jgi:hypothetical protein
VRTVSTAALPSLDLPQTSPFGSDDRSPGTPWRTGFVLSCSLDMHKGASCCPHPARANPREAARDGRCFASVGQPAAHFRDLSYCKMGGRYEADCYRCPPRAGVDARCMWWRRRHLKQREWELEGNADKSGWDARLCLHHYVQSDQWRFHDKRHESQFHHSYALF